jgi:FAD:protein FMN transferase
MTDATVTLRERVYPLIGTTVDITLTVRRGTPDHQSLIDRVVGGLSYWETIFSAYDATSELCRWRVGTLDRPISAFNQVLLAANEWQERSDGRFNPRVGALTERWSKAERDQQLPDQSEMAGLAASIAGPAIEYRDETIAPLGDVTHYTLNAFAKGWIIDHAVRSALIDPSIVMAMINAGGDIARRGLGSTTIGIENPLRPFDNEPLLTRITLSNNGLATSGSARKGFTINGQRFGHVIDPRTGWPVDHTASTSVIADDAATADVMATSLGVLEPTDAIEQANTDNVACFIVGPGGEQYRSARWLRYEDSPSAPHD